MCGKESLEDKSPGEAEAVHLGPHQSKAWSDDQHCLYKNCADHCGNIDMSVLTRFNLFPNKSNNCHTRPRPGLTISIASATIALIIVVGLKS